MNKKSKNILHMNYGSSQFPKNIYSCKRFFEDVYVHTCILLGNNEVNCNSNKKAKRMSLWIMKKRVLG
jgi:hypothetical protein